MALPLVWVAACRPDDGALPETADSAASAPTCEPAPFRDGSLDDDCDGTAGTSIPLAERERLRVSGAEVGFAHGLALGWSVTCTPTPALGFRSAVAAGSLPQEFDGRAVVVDGERTGALVFDAADLVLDGSDELGGAAYGYRVLFPGDTDGDGDGDFVVSHLDAYIPEPQMGEVYVYRGGLRGTVPYNDAAALRIPGLALGAMLGGATRAGDLDGDGRADLVLGNLELHHHDVPGSIAVYTDLPRQGTVTTPTATYVDDDPIPGTGESLVAADVTGDGVTDLVVGEPNAGGFFTPGRVVVLAGPLTASPSTFSAPYALLAGEPYAPLPDDHFDRFPSTGSRLAAGDLDGDGVTDLAIAAHVSGSGAWERVGKVFVFFGPLAPGAGSVADADLVLEGELEFSDLGMPVVLDHDGDGHLDLAVSAPSDPSFVRDRPGLLYVFPGPLGPGTLDLARDAGVVYRGEQPGAWLGGGAMDGCDLDGDGDDELVVGAPSTQVDGHLGLGRVHVLDGGRWDR